MKIRRDEFKSLLKECLQELINEGALNHILMPNSTPQQVPVNPVVGYTARQVARHPQDIKLMENILSDSANHVQEHMAADYMQPYNQPYYGNQYGGQYMQVPQNVQPLPNGGQYQQQPYQQQQLPTSNWARLAFNKPITNRPSQEGGYGGSGGFLPGQNMGKFG